jgi:hypothetical protein
MIVYWLGQVCNLSDLMLEGMIIDWLAARTKLYEKTYVRVRTHTYVTARSHIRVVHGCTCRYS